MSLREAIASERKLLEPIVAAADLVIDTSAMGVHALRELIRERIDRRTDGRLALMFESFGYKHGIPGDADFVFDVAVSQSVLAARLAPSERPRRTGGGVPRGARKRACDDRRAHRVPHRPYRGVRPGEPQLPHHRHRLLLMIVITCLTSS